MCLMIRFFFFVVDVFGTDESATIVPRQAKNKLVALLGDLSSESSGADTCELIRLASDDPTRSSLLLRRYRSVAHGTPPSINGDRPVVHNVVPYLSKAAYTIATRQEGMHVHSPQFLSFANSRNEVQKRF